MKQEKFSPDNTKKFIEYTTKDGCGCHSGDSKCVLQIFENNNLIKEFETPRGGICVTYNEFEGQPMDWYDNNSIILKKIANELCSYETTYNIYNIQGQSHTLWQLVSPCIKGEIIYFNNKTYLFDYSNIITNYTNDIAIHTGNFQIYKIINTNNINYLNLYKLSNNKNCKNKCKKREECIYPECLEFNIKTPHQLIYSKDIINSNITINTNNYKGITFKINETNFEINVKKDLVK